MNDFNGIYNFVSGPLVWVAFIVFIGGSIYKINSLISLVNKKEKYIWTFMSWKYSLRSILHWIIPFASTNWRKRSLMTIVTFAFHISLVCMPFFLAAHVILINEAWGISWSTIPDGLADGMTIVVIIACVFFVLRRLILRDVRFVTTPTDYIMIAIAAAPFITGFMADQQYCNYRLWLILHILSGEIMLMAIPFTRLVHMLYALFTRVYLGSEFGNVRHARDW
jgi:nitrate reductase gamma subunit